MRLRSRTAMIASPGEFDERAVSQGHDSARQIRCARSAGTTATRYRITPRACENSTIDKEIRAPGICPG
jgi:hypothetical protein